MDILTAGRRFLYFPPLLIPLPLFCAVFCIFIRGKKRYLFCFTHPAAQNSARKKFFRILPIWLEFMEFPIFFFLLFQITCVFLLCPQIDIVCVFVHFYRQRDHVVRFPLHTDALSAPRDRSGSCLVFWQKQYILPSLRKGRCFMKYSLFFVTFHLWTPVFMPNC